MSECYVDFSGDSEGADPVEFFNRRDVTGRKEHTCSECRGVIAKSERHSVLVYRFDGDFHAERICAACAEIASEFEHRIFGGVLWGNLMEQWDGGAHVQACMNRLTSVRAKTLMRDQWLAWQERQRERHLRRKRQR